MVRRSASRPQPIFASETTAARMLDMPQATFRALVQDGVLPRPRRLGDLDRYDIEELARIVRGDAVEGMGDVQW